MKGVPMPSQLSRRRLLRSLAALPAVAVLQACSDPKTRHDFSSVDITGADYANAFSLADHNGQTRTLADFQGKAVVMFFGYTQCPDVCPTTMAEMLEVKKLLGPDGDRLQPLFVTVDPERDSAEVLKAYMGAFDPSFLALRPEPTELPALAKKFKLYYKRVEGKTPTSYSMDHSAGSYVFDPQGRVRLYARYGMGAAALAGDLKALIKG